jgi:hypothetical protein
MAQAIFRRDLDVITHTYCERVAAYRLRKSKGTDEVSTEEVISETQQIWGNAEWLAHIDAFCAKMINKNKASAQPRHSSPHITLPPSPTAAPQERSPPSRATTSTPTLNKPVAETPIPSALKELCSLDLGKSIPDFFPASAFVSTNLKYLRSLKGLEMKVLDYAMTKETMDPAYVII